MLKKHKYEIAFSVAEEDLHIAQTIAMFLRARNISYYLYSEHESQHWGENLMSVSFEKYARESKCVLIVLSNIYVTKHWSDIERQVAQAAGKGDTGNILPLRLDDVPLDGLSRNIVYIKWNNDPGEIAHRLGAKIKTIRKKRRQKAFFWVSIAGACVFCFIYSTLLVNYRVHRKIEKEKKELVSDVTTQVTQGGDSAVQTPAKPALPAKDNNAESNENASDTPSMPVSRGMPGYFLTVTGYDKEENSKFINEIIPLLANNGWVQNDDSATVATKFKINCLLGMRTGNAED